VVNNNAGATLLALAALAKGREVIVSRGQLVEIGGSFRIPDVMAQSGAKLVEVGTTNRTHLRDYERALDQHPDTALIMKVHTSNYAVKGFTSAVSARDLAGLAHERGIPVVEDLGSGTLVDLRRYGLPHEPTAAESIAAGVDAVTFSGDKLLGGPQAGFIAGRRELVARIAKHPLKRALRLDKIRLAATEATLKLYADPDRLRRELPTIALLARPAEEIEAAARRLHDALAAALAERGLRLDVEPCRSQIGSGALPLDLMPSWALTLRLERQRPAESSNLEALAAKLRAFKVPVIGRLEEGRLWLDLRCLASEDEALLVQQLGDLRP